MDVIARFILIVSGIIMAGVLGYFCRRRKVISENIAGTLMFRTVVFGWTPVSILSLWLVDLKWSLITLPAISLALPLCMAPVGFLLLRLHSLDRRSAGSFVMSCGLANIGATMGGFICYCLFGIEEGLAYAQLYTISWFLPYICCYYVIARRFGDPDAIIDVPFILSTILDRRSLPMLGAVIGLTLNISGVPMPQFILTFHLIDLLLIPSVLLSFFAIGLQIHLASIAQMPSLYLTLAAAKFLVAPAISFALLALATAMGVVLPPNAYKVVLIEGFMPTAVFAVIIANLFDLNSRLASILFLVNTAIFLVLVLPFLIVAFG